MSCQKFEAPEVRYTLVFFICDFFGMNGLFPLKCFRFCYRLVRFALMLILFFTWAVHSFSIKFLPINFS